MSGLRGFYRISCFSSHTHFTTTQQRPGIFIPNVQKYSCHWAIFRSEEGKFNEGQKGTLVGSEAVLPRGTLSPPAPSRGLRAQSLA